MKRLSIVQSARLSKIHEQQVLRTLQMLGPFSRAKVPRHSGIAAPTACKAVEALTRDRYLEEEVPELSQGRASLKLRIAAQTVPDQG